MAETLLNKTDDGNDMLVITVKHSSGRYYLSVRKETQKEYAGTMMREFLLFADGNFTANIANGRKSQKKLDKYDKYISDNIEEYKNLWLEGNYQSIYNHVLQCV